MSNDKLKDSDFVEGDIEMDRGVTVSPEDWEVTDEVIEKIRRKEMMKEILHDEKLSEKEKFEALEKAGLGIRSLSELRRLTVQLR